MLSGTKLDSTFPYAQFYIEGYFKPYILDRDQNGRGIMLFVREGVPSKLLKVKFSLENKENVLIKLNLRKRKSLIICIYNPHKTTISSYLKDLNKEIDSLSSQYQNTVWYFQDTEPIEGCMSTFCQVHDLENLTKKTYLFQNPEKPRTIDLGAVYMRTGTG